MSAATDPAYAGYIKNYYGNREGLQRLFPDAEILYLTGQTAIVYLRLDQGGKPSVSRFGYNAIPHLFSAMDYGAAAETGVLQLRQIPVLQLDGQGTLVAVPDSGIDFRSAAFRDSFGRSRIVRLWDMTDDSGQAPPFFGFGSEYTQEQINAMLFTPEDGTAPGADPDGHGTRMAGIAAGSILPDRQFTGMAPEAGLIVVKLKEAKPYLKEYYGAAPETVCYGEDDLMLAVRYAVLAAEELRRPVSIAIGVGSGLGSHAGTGPLALYLNRLGNSAGTAVSAAAGNEGNQGHHYSGRIETGQYDEVQLRVGEKEYGFTAELWGTVPNSYSVAVQSPSGELIPVFARGRNAEVPIEFIFEETKIYVDDVLSEEESGFPMIQMRFLRPAPGIWSIRVYGAGNTGPIPYQMWLPASGLISENTYFLRPSPEITITEPANAYGVITAAAFDDSTRTLYLENGRGWTVDDRVKPTLSAPGVNLQTPFAGGFSEASGTSLAAAVTAGCASLLLQWGIVLGRNPLLTGVTLRNYLIRGARREGNMTYPNRLWGYGELDVYQTFLSLRGDGFSI